MRIQQEHRAKAIAKSFRKRMTPQERLLWYACLKRCPEQVYRQYAIGNYIADFFCRKAGLVIEVDGRQHYTEEAMAYDQKRSAVMKEKGILVLRVSNADIEHNLKNVSQHIMNVIEERIREKEAEMQ